MTEHKFSMNRRTFIGSALSGAACIGAPFSTVVPAGAQQAATLGLKIVPRDLRLMPELPPTPIWALASDQPDAALRYTRGDELAVLVSNEATSPIALNWLGFDGTTTLEPLTGATTIPRNGQGKIVAQLKQAGTFLIDPRLLGDGAERPFSTAAVVIEGAKRSGTERDELFLIEDWRIAANGKAISPGQSADGTSVVYTVNGLPPRDISLQQNERLRLRIINACARAPIGLKIENHDVRVMAIDSQPAEPFLARDGQLVLTPGSRIDVLIDATAAPGTTSAIIMHDGTGPRTVGRLITSREPPQRPAPLPPAASLSVAHLPAQLDLKNAQRIELQLDAKAPWIAPISFNTSMPPVVQAKRGRVVVMAVTNPTATPVSFRLHGHHFRLLDRLDDGWKPFWLDTLMLDVRQTQRIAFLAEFTGNWLIESAAIGWASPKLVRHYAVA